jgi:hypothetical protein
MIQTFILNVNKSEPVFCKLDQPANLQQHLCPGWFRPYPYDREMSAGKVRQFAHPAKATKVKAPCQTGSACQPGRLREFFQFWSWLMRFDGWFEEAEMPRTVSRFAALGMEVRPDAYRGEQQADLFVQ